MKRMWIISIGLMLMPVLATAQVFADSEERFDSLYAVRIQMEEIDGVYIPYDLEDAIAELKRLSPPEDLEKFKEAPEDLVAEKLHFGLGRWTIYNWGFYQGSRLSHYLKQIGLEHPDDMAKFLIISLHRDLNDSPMNSDELVKQFRDKREAERMAREAGKEVIIDEKRPKKN